MKKLDLPKFPSSGGIWAHDLWVEMITDQVCRLGVTETTVRPCNLLTARCLVWWYHSGSDVNRSASCVPDALKTLGTHHDFTCPCGRMSIENHKSIKISSYLNFSPTNRAFSHQHRRRHMVNIANIKQASLLVHSFHYHETTTPLIGCWYKHR